MPTDQENVFAIMGVCYATYTCAKAYWVFVKINIQHVGFVMMLKKKFVAFFFFIFLQKMANSEN